MAISIVTFIMLLSAVAILRLWELVLSMRNQKRLLSLGASKIFEPDFRWMVITHIGVLIGAAIEVIFLKRPFVPMLAATMGALFISANALRWWVIRTLRSFWTVRVMNCARFGVVTDGPFRFVRHPNYAAVFVELFALPLIHTAWLTAFLGSVLHVWALSRRLAVEEPVLMDNKLYVETMAHKCRFIPGLF